MACKNVMCLIVFAMVVGAVAVAFTAVAFATDHWVEIKVDRSFSKITDREIEMSSTNAKMAKIYYDRNRGVLRECYPGSTTMPWTDAQNGAEEVCFTVSLEEAPDAASDDYVTQMHMKRAMVTFSVLGVVFVAVTFISGFVPCCLWSLVAAQFSACSSFIAAICTLVSIVMLHCIEYLSVNKKGNIGEYEFQANWAAGLQEATSISYGYSYACAWVGVILSGFSGILFLLVARAIYLLGPKDLDSDSDTSSEYDSTNKKRSGESDYEPDFVYDNQSMAKSEDNFPTYPLGHPALRALPNYPAVGYAMPQ